MRTLKFDREFLCPLDAGEKCRTIRKEADVAPGDPVLLLAGDEEVRDVTCTRVRPVEISHIEVILDGRHLFAGDAPAFAGGVDPEHYDGDFARADGFNSFTDMVEYFDKRYGLPFTGHLIEWRL